LIHFYKSFSIYNNDVSVSKFVHQSFYWMSSRVWKSQFTSDRKP